jgi:hypothetical protein
VGGAVRLNRRENDAVINWSGGLHHAKARRRARRADTRRLPAPPYARVRLQPCVQC